jgi:RNA ligase
VNYSFPNILHIDDIRPAIAGRTDFIIAERDWGYVVNYVVAMPDTFPPVEEELWSSGYWCPGCKKPMSETESCSSQRCPEPVNLAAVRRECRGLLFDRAGNILSRRLHKFFNVNEREETLARAIDFTQPHSILEKLDGSMVTPIQVDAHIRWATKMGITDVSMNAEVYVSRNIHYQEFADYIMSFDATPIFEWCSTKNRIVVEYPHDRLVLLAIRDNVSGDYKSYESMCNLASQYGVEVVKAYSGNASSMQQLLDTTKELQGAEGYIIRFDNGHMVKVKGEWYVRIHKVKDSLSQEKNIIDLLVNDKIDDIKPHMLDSDRQSLEHFETSFWSGINTQVENYQRYFSMVISSGLDRKAYAQNWMPTIIKQDPHAPSIVFGCFDGRDIRTMILDTIRKNCTTRTRIDSVRQLWEGHRWQYGFNGEE